MSLDKLGNFNCVTVVCCPPDISDYSPFEYFLNGCLTMTDLWCWAPITNGNKLLRVYRVQGPYSLSSKTSYRQISRSLEAAKLDVIMMVSLWNLTDISAVLQPMCLSNFSVIRNVLACISCLWDSTGSCGKASVRLVNRCPDDGFPCVKPMAPPDDIGYHRTPSSLVQLMAENFPILGPILDFIM